MSITPFLVLFSAIFFLNIPFGFWRAGTRKFSVKWFLAIHLPIPAIYFLRKLENITAWVIPFSVMIAVAGQIVGGKIRDKIKPAALTAGRHGTVDS